MNLPMSRAGALYLLLGCAQAAHSVEEMLAHLYDFFWVVSGMLHRALAWYPQFRWPADRFAAVNMIFIAVLLGSWPFVESRQRWALLLAQAAAVIEILNGLNHLAGAIVFRRYVPGVITAPLLLLLGVLVLRELKSAGRAATDSLIAKKNTQIA